MQVDLLALISFVAGLFIGFGLGILILRKRIKFMHIGFLYLAFLIVAGLSDVVSLGDPIAVNMGKGLFVGVVLKILKERAPDLF